MIVEESFALGKSKNEINFKLWDLKSVECTRSSLRKPTKIFLFGINAINDYKEAQYLNINAIFTDYPSLLISKIKA